MTNGTITHDALLMFTYCVGAAVAECERIRTPIDPKTFRETLSLHVHETQNRSDVNRQDSWAIGKLLDLALSAAEAQKN